MLGIMFGHCSGYLLRPDYDLKLYDLLGLEVEGGPNTRLAEHRDRPE